MELCALRFQGAYHYATYYYRTPQAQFQGDYYLPQFQDLSLTM